MASTQPAPVTAVRGSADGRKSKRGGGGPDTVVVPNPQPIAKLSPEDEKMVYPSDATTIDTKDVPNEPISSAPPAPMTPGEVQAALATTETPASNPLDTHPEAQRNPAPFFSRGHEYVIRDAPELSEEMINKIPREFAMVARIGTPASITLIHSRDVHDASGTKRTLPCVMANFSRVGADKNIRRFNVMHVPEVQAGRVHWATVSLELMTTKYYMVDPRTKVVLIYPWSDYTENRDDALVLQRQMQEHRLTREREIQDKANKRGAVTRQMIQEIHRAAAAG